MKKLLGTLVAVGAMALMAVGVQAATYSAGVDIKPVEGIAEVPVLVTPDAEEGTESVNGYVMTFTYDSSKVTPVKADADVIGEDCYATVGTEFAAENSVLVSDFVETENSDNMKTLAVAWAGADAVEVSKETTMASVKFDVTDGTTGTVDIDVAVVALTNDGDAIAADGTYLVNSGTITIDADVVLGDVTGNGVVNMDDVTLLTQYVNMVYDRDSILDAYPKSNVDAGNVSGKDNDTINMDDVTVLTQYVNMVFDSLEDIQ